jgi:hypothetical protein
MPEAQTRLRSRLLLLTDRFRTAQRDRELAVLESFHAVTHVLRLGLACGWPPRPRRPAY